jgi:hypothetical protein
LPHELEGLPQKRKVSEPKSIYCRIARPPEAHALPLMLRNVGTSHWQLYG